MQAQMLHVEYISGEDTSEGSSAFVFEELRAATNAASTAGISAQATALLAKQLPPSVGGEASSVTTGSAAAVDEVITSGHALAIMWMSHAMAVVQCAASSLQSDDERQRQRDIEGKQLCVYMFRGCWVFSLPKGDQCFRASNVYAPSVMGLAASAHKLHNMPLMQGYCHYYFK